MEKHHAFASLQQIQKVGLEGLWGFSVEGPPRLKVNARHIVEDQAIIISRQCWAQYFARKRLFDVGVIDGESVKKIKEGALFEGMSFGNQQDVGRRHSSSDWAQRFK